MREIKGSREVIVSATGCRLTFDWTRSSGFCEGSETFAYSETNQLVAGGGPMEERKCGTYEHGKEEEKNERQDRGGAMRRLFAASVTILTFARISFIAVPTVINLPAEEI